MSNLVGVVELRNRRCVFSYGDAFRIESRNWRGSLHVTEIPSIIVDAIGRSFAGMTVTVEQVAPLAGRLAAEHGLPYWYGHKRRFFAQDGLLVLVALDRATHEKAGRGWRYTVKG